MERKMKKSIKAVVAILVSVIGSVLLIGCGEKTVNLNECVEVEISGIDGQGKAELDIDYDKMEIMLAEAMNIDLEEDVESLEDLGTAFEGVEKIEAAEECVEFQLKSGENLKNGDKVTVEAIIDEQTAKEYKIKFKFKKVEKKVSGLQEAINITQKELFEDVVVEFIGVAPEAEVQVRNTSKDKVLSEVEFSVDEYNGLDKGDTVVVSAIIPDELEEQGYVFENTDKEYTVENVDSYVSSFKEIPQEGLQSIMSQAKDMIEGQLKAKEVDSTFIKGDEFISLVNSFETISQPKLEKSYFYALKEGIDSYYECKNAMGITYTFDVTQMGGGMFEKAPEDYQGCYILISCQDMILTKEGKLQFDIDTMEFSNGYASFDSFYTDQEKKKKDMYEIEEIDLSLYK